MESEREESSARVGNDEREDDLEEVEIIINEEEDDDSSVDDGSTDEDSVSSVESVDAAAYFEELEFHREENSGINNSSNSSSNGDDEREDLEEVEIIINEEDEDSSVASLDPTAYYDELMGKIRANKCWTLKVQLKSVFDHILEHIDGFCEALSTASAQEDCNVRTIVLGDNGSDVEFSKCVITKQNSFAWSKFFHAIGSLDCVGYLHLGGSNLSAEVMTGIVTSMQRVELHEIILNLPYTISGEDMRPFVKAMENHSCENVTLDLCNVDSDSELQSEPVNHFQDGNIFHRLLCLEGLKALHINECSFSFDECKSLGHILTSNACAASFLQLKNCFFEGAGGRAIGNAFRSNTLVRSIVVRTTCQDEHFSDALINSLSFNRFIKEARFYFYSVERNFDFVLKLIKVVGHHNEAIERLTFVFGGFHGLHWRSFFDETTRAEMQQDLMHNYTLKYLHLAGQRLPDFDGILELNRAGRIYLKQDVPSQSQCIDVLAKVKHDLNCLFLHLRECNPVLLANIHRRGDHCAAGNKKRKATDALEINSQGGVRAFGLLAWKDNK